MPNTLLTSQVILNEMIRRLHNASAFLGNVNTDYNDTFGKGGTFGKVGSVVNVRIPPRYTVRTGANANVQDTVESTKPITMEQEFGIDTVFSDYDLSLTIDDFSNRYLASAAQILATQVDTRIASRFYQSTSNFIGTPGTLPSAYTTVWDAQAVLTDNSCPDSENITYAITPKLRSGLLGSMSTLFNANSDISSQNKQGRLKTNLGVDFQTSPNVPVHTVGVFGGTPVVNGANQGIINSGSTDNPTALTTSLVTNGWSAGSIMNAGDVISLAGVFAVNPDNKQSLQVLKNFVVTQTVTADGSGNMTVIISPAIIAGGAYQNVTARPANTASITVKTGSSGASYAQNMMFDKDAFTFVTVDMEEVKGVDMYAKTTFGGVTMRMVRQYDINTNRRIVRFDILAGYGPLRNEWAVRVTS